MPGSDPTPQELRAAGRCSLCASDAPDGGRRESQQERFGVSRTHHLCRDCERKMEKEYAPWHQVELNPPWVHPQGKPVLEEEPDVPQRHLAHELAQQLEREPESADSETAIHAALALARSNVDYYRAKIDMVMKRGGHRGHEREEIRRWQDVVGEWERCAELLSKALD